jgi:hypothetical protein
VSGESDILGILEFRRRKSGALGEYHCLNRISL